MPESIESLKPCVVYTIATHQSPQSTLLFGANTQRAQEHQIAMLLKAAPEKTVVSIFTEAPSHTRQRHRWPELSHAVDYCLAHQTHLIIGELKNLTRNEAFAHQILRLLGEIRTPEEISADQFKGDLYCCDQPFITGENFLAIVQHNQEQRKLHGQLIKEGLSKTTAKSGNPHAADLIAQVNKPKIDNAIVFALLLQPVINEYEARGYSQRKMVDTLNEEGFTAPEGGHWVLSQFQKVLERVHLNEMAFRCEKQLLEYRGRGLSDIEIANKLNEYGISGPKGARWDADYVLKVSDRIKHIHDILRFNEFVLALSPILSAYHIDDINESILMDAIRETGVEPPSAMID